MLSALHRAIFVAQWKRLCQKKPGTSSSPAFFDLHLHWTAAPKRPSLIPSMNNLKISSAIITLLLLVGLPLHAQEKRVSPHETVSASIDGAQIKVVYGRPYTKDPKSGEMRKIWGGLVPFGQVWRMGADEATLLTTDRDLAMGGTKIPAGTYSLYLQPEENGSAKLIVNKQTGQWGTKHDESQDFAKIEMKKNPLAPAVNQFTITLDKNSSGGGTLRLKWETTVYSTPIKVQK
jgi:hypothetical protein